MSQDHTDKKGKKGRPLKKDYDAETLMQELIDTVVTKQNGLQVGCGELNKEIERQLSRAEARLLLYLL